jgi:hypothetical protein
VYWGSSLKPNGNLKQIHALRQFLHPQLKALWGVNPTLKSLNSPKIFGPINVEGGGVDTWQNVMSKKFNRCGIGFVPLVTKELNLACELDVLFLRREEPGQLVSGGDIDNRLKTLFDALRIPTECAGISSVEEDPFFCLLEDDGLITRVNVSTDRLLLPDGDLSNPKDVVLVINTHVYPTALTLINLGF